jgi:phage protein D
MKAFAREAISMTSSCDVTTLQTRAPAVVASPSLASLHSSMALDADELQAKDAVLARLRANGLFDILKVRLQFEVLSLGASSLTMMANRRR